MLNILFGDTQSCVYNTSIYFDNTYEDEWLKSDIAKQIIKDIEMKVPQHIIPEELSWGTKTLLLILNDNTQIFNISVCGDNCAKWILKIAEEKDITVRLGHAMKFEEPFKIRILNSNQIISSREEFLMQEHKYTRE